MATTKRAKAKQDVSYEPTRTGMSVDALKRAFLDNLFYVQGRFPDVATPNDYYQALAYTVRDRLLHRWITTAQTYKDSGSRTVCYLSAEFLLGPHLQNNIINLGILDEVRQAMEGLGLDPDELLAQEEEPGLGNGGLGRLAPWPPCRWLPSATAYATSSGSSTRRSATVGRSSSLTSGCTGAIPGS
jgi:starch phosphorylase